MKLTAEKAYEKTVAVCEAYKDGDLLGGNPMCWIENYAEQYHKEKLKKSPKIKNSKEIKKSIDFLMQQLEIWEKVKSVHKLEIRKVDDSIKLIYEEIQRIRKFCKHTYLNKPNTMMGRGTCDICKESDY